MSIKSRYFGYYLKGQQAIESKYGSDEEDLDKLKYLRVTSWPDVRRGEIDREPKTRARVAIKTFKWRSLNFHLFFLKFSSMLNWARKGNTHTNTAIQYQTLTSTFWIGCEICMAHRTNCITCVYSICTHTVFTRWICTHNSYRSCDVVVCWLYYVILWCARVSIQLSHMVVDCFSHFCAIKQINRYTESRIYVCRRSHRILVTVISYIM